MELFRNVLFMLAGVGITYGVLDGTPRDEWFSTTVILCLALTAALVVVEVAFRLITRVAEGPTRARAQRGTERLPSDR